MLTNLVASLNSKGGVGKTTAAAHLAGIAAAQGWRTLVLDCDAQGNLHRSLGHDFDNGQHLRDALLGIEELQPRSDTRSNLDYVGGGELIEEATMQLRAKSADGDPSVLYRLQDMLRAVAGDYDLIVVDSPPRELFLRRMILTCAHYVVIPVDKDEAAYDGLAAVLRSIGEARDYGNPALEILSILRFRVGSEKMAMEIKTDVEAIAGEDLVLKAWIRNALRAADDLRRDSMLAHEYEEASKDAMPWWKRRQLGEGASEAKTFSGAAAGLADDWWEAVTEILTEYTNRAGAVAAGEGVR